MRGVKASAQLVAATDRLRTCERRIFEGSVTHGRYLSVKRGYQKNERGKRQPHGPKKDGSHTTR